MGYNTTVVVMNDSLSAIEKDPDFGKKLVAAIMHASLTRKPEDVSALGHVNAATVIETHHADSTALVAVGGNYGTKLFEKYGFEHHTKEKQWDLLEAAYSESVKAAPEGIDGDSD